MTNRWCVSDELRQTLLKVSTVTPEFSATVGNLEQGWFCASELGDATGNRLGEALQQTAKNYPGADARAQGALFMNQYAWNVSGVAIAAFLMQKRVPDLVSNNMALRTSTITWEEDGESSEYDQLEVRFLSGHFAALLDDPMAGQVDVLTLPDVDSLREWLRQRLEAHLQPIIARIHTNCGLSQAALWRIVADCCAQAFLQAGRQCNVETEGERHGLAFVKVPGSPLNNPQLHLELSLAEGDVVFVFGDPSELFENPLWNALSAVQDGRAYEVGYYWWGDSLLSAHRMLDDLFFYVAGIRESLEFKEGHARSSTLPSGTFTGHPQFELHEIIQSTIQIVREADQ